VPDDRQQRLARLQERLRTHRGRQLRDDVADEVERIAGFRPGLDEFLSAAATDRLTERYLIGARKPDRQRRTWSSDLAEDVRTSLVATAEHLAGVPAYWLHRLSPDAGAVLVPTDRVLRHAARTFAPGNYDVVLVSDDGESGLRFAWDHLPEADEYELVTWGAFHPL
jgi:hypothetical protein